LDRPVYVTDIATDPLWDNHRHLALAHGLHSCWSTPIRDSEGSVIGTFAIYHRTTRGPTRDELEAIDLITGHVSQAIVRAHAGEREPPRLRLVGDNPIRPGDPFYGLLSKIARLENILAQLEREALSHESQESRAEMKHLAENSRKLADVVREHVERLRELPPMRR
jgi:GAF domain-containing protein